MTSGGARPQGPRRDEWALDATEGWGKIRMGDWSSGRDGASCAVVPTLT
jgi:hypothetical protein